MGLSIKFFAITACLLVYASGALCQEGGKTGFLWHDPNKIMKAEECGVCHVREFKLWDTTAHARGRNVDRGYENAEGIKERMGVVSLRHESLCIRCHSTGGVDDDGRFIAISGVSCESCHGAGRNWINVHNKNTAGTGAEKAERNKKAKEAGMLRPSELYDVVANCFQCHTVPHEELVNKGGHPAGSSTFDLLSRIDQIRHNFLEAQFNPEKTDNRKPTAARLRQLYIVGAVIELEYNIRGAAQAKENAGFFKAMQRRVRGAIVKLTAISNKASVPEIKTMLATIGGVEVVPNNQRALTNAADEVQKLARKIAGTYKGNELAGLDGLIAGTDDGSAVSPPAPNPSGETTEITEETRQPEIVPAQPVVAQAPHAVPQPSYKIKTSLRPKSKYDVINDCNCHKSENDWMFSDRHSQSAIPFNNKSAKVLQIARNYGLKPSEITKGNRLCMDCHGTVISGQESFDVLDGAGCESCHGPASGYVKQHSVKGGGYPLGKDHGMLVLTDAQVRAEACAQCHYITDPRLLSAGHPSGKDFDLAKRNAKINHWKDDPPAGELNAAYASAKQKRGGVPDVASITAAVTSTESGSVQHTVNVSQQSNQVVVAPPPPRPAPVASRIIPSQRKQINLSAFPSITDSTSVEKVLLLMKSRIEEMYKQVEK